MSSPTIDQITIADAPESWSALGFTVADRRCLLGQVELQLVGSQEDMEPRSGILAWSLRDLSSADLDGLPTSISGRPAPDRAPAHPNGVVAIDHIVAVSSAFERAVATMQTAGLDLRRVREEPTPAGAPRQAFFRLGGEILELVEEPAEVTARDGGPQRPVRFWGLALLVENLDRIAAALAPHIGEVRAAVQPGRRIATVRRSAGLAAPLALISADAGGARER
ncbi:MAG: VOC family protein [Solirubrobacteraceae bacterium]